MMPPFPITPAMSLNRARIVDLPGLAIDPAVKGKTGYELVSAMALTNLIREHGDQLELDASMGERDLHLALDACFVDPRKMVRAAAEKVAARIGRNFGYLLLTLKRGDEVNRQARDEWDDRYWTHWGQVRQVWLGGGLVSGRLGPRIRTRALSIFAEAGIGDFAIDISPYGSALPLVGAARYVPAGDDSALVIDFGSTAIKRAIAQDADGQLGEIHLLPSLANDWSSIEATTGDPAQQATLLLDRMVSVIGESWREAGTISASPSRTVPVGVAAYVQDGQPMAGQGGMYYLLRLITQNAQAELGQRLSACLGVPLSVALIHDGTAAAMAYAGMPHTAVITVGTALGIGFPPEMTDLRPLSANLTVVNQD